MVQSSQLKSGGITQQCVLIVHQIKNEATDGRIQNELKSQVKNS